MPTLVGAQRGMNVYDYRNPGYTNGIAHHDMPYNGDDGYYDRDDMRREEDERFHRGYRNGGPSNDRFNDYFERDRSSMIPVNSGEPMFQLDHLATFAAGTRNGPLHAEDGLRKLRHMQNTTGIWTMRCMLVVERNHLVIIDHGNGDELERFPLMNIVDPTAIFKNDHREHYNNLILFTVVEDPKKRAHQADMHIFQACGGGPPQAIVDEILAAKSGQPRVVAAKIPPPPVGPAPEPPNGAYNLQQMREYLDPPQPVSYGFETRQNYFGASSRPPQQSRLTRVSAIVEREDIDGGGNTQLMERDVTLLNHCFDDVEKFVARLQQAAEAFKELERRKRERGAKNRKRQSGDGMLNARAKPPEDRDFVNIFQKFKLAFNLLSKLKAHIHDPNAPELVHFLFTPLSLIYEASRDPHHGNQDLGNMAVAPVLTDDAKLLLQNCLTSKELELWHTLGKHWTTSMSEWQGAIPRYVPEFYDGWQPAGSLVDEVVSRPPPPPPQPMVLPEPPRPLYEHHHSLYRGTAPRPQPFPDEDPRPLNSLDPYSSHQPVPITSHLEKSTKDLGRSNRFPLMSHEDENNQYLEDLMRTDDAIIYEAAHERAGKNAKELDVKKGDILQVIDNTKNWWRLRNSKGKVGFAPYTILKGVRTEDDLGRNGHAASSRSNYDRTSSRRGDNKYF